MKFYLTICYSITSGREVDENICDFLLNVESIGRSARKRFIQRCNENPQRFESPVSKMKVFDTCYNAAAILLACIRLQAVWMVNVHRIKST